MCGTTIGILYIYSFLDFKETIKLAIIIPSTTAIIDYIALMYKVNDRLFKKLEFVNILV